MPTFDFRGFTVFYIAVISSRWTYFLVQQLSCSLREFQNIIFLWIQFPKQDDSYFI